MSAVEDILNYKKNPDEDLYALLNCDEHSTVEQIQAEFKVLALEHHPDKNDGNKESEAKFQMLNEAKDILCDPERRANYDKWRSAGIQISYKNWVAMKDGVEQSMHWAKPKTKDRMLPETSNLTTSQPNHGHRRASEGGALLYKGGKKSDASNEVVSKFRNYEI